MGFPERLAAAMRRCGTPTLVGIDPRPDWLPEPLLARFPAGVAGTAAAVQAFDAAVLDVVAPLVPAVKFQAAFYERLGVQGIAALAAGIRDAQGKGLIVLVDGKRNDIGSTAVAYAEAYLGRIESRGEAAEPWGADALTINPYLGRDGIAPFVEVAAHEGRGVFVLVRTSNPSAGDFQDLVCEGKPLYRHVAERVAEWAAPHRDGSGYSLLGAVVGATYPEQLAELRETMPGVPLLVPGYGSQGGTARDVAAAFAADGLGALINNSRGLVFAYRQPAYRDRFGGDWQRAIEQATRDMIEDLAAHTPAGRLRRP